MLLYAWISLYRWKYTPNLCADIAAIRDSDSQWFQKSIQGTTCGVCAIPYIRIDELDLSMLLTPQGIDALSSPVQQHYLEYYSK